MASKPIILEPQFGVCFPRVLWDVGQQLVPWWEGGVEDVSTEGLRSWQVRAQASVFRAVVASATTRVVAMASLLPLVAVDTPAGIKGVARAMVATETLMHRDRDVRPAALRRLVD